MLCDSYIIEFEYYPTCNYYERGKYGCRNFHVTKLPLFMLGLLWFLSSSLHMLVFACLDNLFAYIMPMHRKYVRPRSDFHMLHDAPFVFQLLSFMRGSLKLSMSSWRGNPTLFLFIALWLCLVMNNSSILCLDVVLCFN